MYLVWARPVYIWWIIKDKANIYCTFSLPRGKLNSDRVTQWLLLSGWVSRLELGKYHFLTKYRCEVFVFVSTYCPVSEVAVNPSLLIFPGFSSKYSNNKLECHYQWTISEKKKSALLCIDLHSSTICRIAYHYFFGNIVVNTETD